MIGMRVRISMVGTICIRQVIIISEIKARNAKGTMVE